MCFKGSKNQQSWLPFGNSSQKGGVFMHVDRGRFFVFVDRGRFRLYLGDSWCIHFFWLMMYLFYWLYMLGGDICALCLLFLLFLDSHMVQLIIDLDLWGYSWCIFFVLWNQEFISFTCIFHTCVYMFVECFKNIQVYSIMLLSTMATDR